MAAAAVPWNKLFWERFDDSFTLTDVIADCLAAVAHDLSLPLRGSHKDRDLSLPQRGSDKDLDLALPLRGIDDDLDLALPLPGIDDDRDLALLLLGIDDDRDLALPRGSDDDRDHALPRGSDDDRDLALALRSSDDDDRDRALLKIEEMKKMLAEASKVFSLAIAAFGTVELLARRCMGFDDAPEIAARSSARVARERACTAYDALTSSRGPLAAAGRLVATPGTPSHAVEEERVTALGAIEAAIELLAEAQAVRSSDATHADVALLRSHSRRPSVAAATPKPVGTEGARFSAALSSVLGASVTVELRRIALSGTVPEIEGAQAALQVGAAAFIKPPKVASADGRSGCYNAAFRALGAAHTELSDLLALSSEVDAILRRCAPDLSADRTAPCLPSDSWDASRADTERHGRTALRRVWSALSDLDYCFNGTLLWESSSWAGTEAREAMGRALVDAGVARDAGELLRHAASIRFFHAARVFFNPAASSG
ncbi:hypothetical protein ACQ4PT_063481 [Festuca glaucescens]